MPNDNVKDMVNSLAGGDNIKAQDAFKNALSDKIGQALDDKRQSVATDWLNSAQDQEAIKDASGLDAGASVWLHQDKNRLLKNLLLMKLR